MAGPCGTFYTTGTSYPGGVAFSNDGKSAYALLNQNNTLAKIDLTATPPTQGTQIRVGNAPHSIVIDATARPPMSATRAAGPPRRRTSRSTPPAPPIVADPVDGAAITGTVSVVDLTSMQVTATIKTGLHPTGMALFGTVPAGRQHLQRHHLGHRHGHQHGGAHDQPGAADRSARRRQPAYGAAPTSIAVDANNGVAYVALYNANAIAVVDLSSGAPNPVLGMIPVAYAPASVVLDTTNNQLIVANDKGIGTRVFVRDRPRRHRLQHPPGQRHRQHRPGAEQRDSGDDDEAGLPEQPLGSDAEYRSAGGGSPTTTPVALPAHIGDPSLIKHVFLIIRENRTYDQILGDVAAGNGDASLGRVRRQGSRRTRTALVQRFPLLDNFYDPSRQSADGHQWIIEGMAPYADDIQSPDWVRSYPGGNAGDALAYQNKGFLFPEAAAAGLPVKIYGEYVENDTFLQPNGSTGDRAGASSTPTRRLRRRADCETWRGRDDAVLSERDPGRILDPGRV